MDMVGKSDITLLLALPLWIPLLKGSERRSLVCEEEQKADKMRATRYGLGNG